MNKDWKLENNIFRVEQCSSVHWKTTFVFQYWNFHKLITKRVPNQSGSFRTYGWSFLSFEAVIERITIFSNAFIILIYSSNRFYEKLFGLLAIYNQILVNIKYTKLKLLLNAEFVCFASAFFLWRKIIFKIAFLILLPSTTNLKSTFVANLCNFFSMSFISECSSTHACLIRKSQEWKPKENTKKDPRIWMAMYQEFSCHKEYF